MSDASENFRTVIESATALTVAYLAWHQTKLGVNVKKIEKQTDGMSEKLGVAEHAAGKLEGVAEEKDKQNNP